jgi:cytochrome b561
MHPSHYSLWSRRLHWLTFILVTLLLILIYGHGWSPKDSAIRAAFKWSHIQLGIVLILVLIPRFIVRARSKAPDIVPPPPTGQMRIARLVQLVLYALLIAVPLLGLSNRLWSPSDWDFLGIALPHVAVPDRAFAKQIQEIHGTLGNVLMYLAGAHALIALVHHFVLRDSTLRGMLPFWGKGEDRG